MRALLLALALGACASPPAALPDAPADLPIFVVPQRGHTGIAVRAADVPGPLIPEKRDFPGADFLEFGWGDRDYYMAETPGLWLTFKAAFLPTPSVVHVAGVRGALGAAFPGAGIVELRVSRPALDGLLRHVHDTFERNGAAAKSLGGGFYPARETFHLLRTCNVWTAGALRAAGLPVHGALTVEGILRQVRPLAAPALSGR